MCTNTSTELLISLNEGVRSIKFNRTKKKNALSEEMYIELTNILMTDAADDSIVLTIITGVGDYFTSGNDLSMISKSEEAIHKALGSFKNFVTALLNYPKLVIAVVNGPAVGVGVTALALCDVVYATDRATFMTPFVRLGICPEACSSYLFPRIMGNSKANELLLLGRKITAQEAYESNLVSKVIPHEKLDDFINDLHKYNQLSVDSIKICKRLIRESSDKDLHAINECEVDSIIRCVTGTDGPHEILKYKSKSKL